MTNPMRLIQGSSTTQRQHLRSGSPQCWNKVQHRDSRISVILLHNFVNFWCYRKLKNYSGALFREFRMDAVQNEIWRKVDVQNGNGYRYWFHVFISSISVFLFSWFPINTSEDYQFGVIEMCMGSDIGRGLESWKKRGRVIWFAVSCPLWRILMKADLLP